MAKRKLGLAGLLLAGTLTLLTGVLGCRHKDDDPIIPIPPVNNPPVLEQPADENIYENALYTKTINMDDADGDDLTPYFITAPAGASVNKTGPNTAEVSWTPDDSQSDMVNSFTLGVDDGNGGTDAKSWSVYATNVSDVVISVNECGSGNPGTPIEGVEVSLDSDTRYTDSAGACTFPNKPNGSYSFVLKDPLATFVTHKPKNLEVSKAEQDAGNLTLEKRLIPEDYFDFMEPSVRLSGQICKFDPSAIIIFDIYKTEVRDSNPVPQANIDLVRNLILNKLSNRWSYAFTNANIAEHDSLPPFVQPTDNHITVYWNNNFGGGINGTWVNGTRILSAYARCNISNGEETWMNEFSNLFTNSDDSNLYTSVRNDPSTETNFTYADDVVDDFHNKRPEGNRNLNDGNPDNRDVDPSP